MGQLIRMGLLRDIFRRPRDVQGSVYRSVTEYSPAFSSWDGRIYEQELTRAAIDRFATACSKLKPESFGPAKPAISRAFATSPNDHMTWPQFLYRLATIQEADTTAAVVPTLAADGQTMTGLWPLKFSHAEIVEYKGEPWVRFHLPQGDVAAIEYSKACFVTRFQYESDFFGGGNCLDRTMGLIHANAEAQQNAIRQGAKVRFIGKLTGQVREEDMKRKRERFAEDNLGPDNQSGLMLYDQTFDAIQQVSPQSYTIDASEMERIEKNVYTYFGTNEDILQNRFSEDDWAAYYEGKVEPFAVQLAEGLNRILYTRRERLGNRVVFTANRLEYSSMASKRNMVRDMLDRGVMSINEAREILQMSPVPDGDVRVIRGEYKDAEKGVEFDQDTEEHPKDYEFLGVQKDSDDDADAV